MPHKTKETKQQTDFSKPTLLLDLKEFVHYLDGLGLTEEQALICIKEIHEFALQWISFGGNIHPIQQAEQACGKEVGNTEKMPVSGENEVSLLGQFIKENLAEYTALEQSGKEKES
ncbi:MAG: hypothetical protein HWE30_03575 [Methylocystaceae bacterium]|nr:hypothetical protein [Methylocystaceae bacterium]